MTNDNDSTFHDLASALRKIDRLKAEIAQLAAANHELFDELRRHVEDCECKLDVKLSSTATNALRDLLAPMLTLLQKLRSGPKGQRGEYAVYASYLTIHEVDKEFARFRALI